MSNVAQMSDVGISILSKSQLGIPVQLTRIVLLNLDIEDGSVSFINPSSYIESFGIDELIFVDYDNVAMIRCLIHNQTNQLSTSKSARAVAVLALHYETGNEVIYAYYNFGSNEIIPARNSAYYEQVFDLQIKLTRNTRIVDGEVKPPYLATKKDIINHNLDANAHPLYNLWIATLSGNVKLDEHQLSLGPGAYQSIPRDASKSYVVFLPSVDRQLYLAGNISYDRSLATDAYYSALYYGDNAQLVPGLRTDYGQDYPASRRYGTSRVKRGVLAAATTTSFTDTSSAAIASLKSLVIIQDIKDRRWSYVLSYGSVLDTPEGVGDSIVELENYDDSSAFNLYCLNRHCFVSYDSTLTKIAKSKLSSLTFINTDMRVIKGELVICGYFEKSGRLFGYLEVIDKLTGLRKSLRIVKPTNLSGTQLGDVRLHQMHFDESTNRLFLVGEYKAYSGTWGSLVAECNPETFETVSASVYNSKYGDVLTYLGSATHETQTDIFIIYSLTTTQQVLVAYSKNTFVIRYVKMIMNARLRKGELALSKEGELLYANPSDTVGFWSNTIGYANLSLVNIGLSNILEDPYLIDDPTVGISRAVYDNDSRYFYLSGFTENHLATARLTPLTKYTRSGAGDGRIEFLDPIQRVTESSAYNYYFEHSVISLGQQDEFSDTPTRIVDNTESETLGFYQTDMYVNKLTPDVNIPEVDEDQYITKFYGIQTTDHITIVSDAVKTTNNIGPSKFNVAVEEDINNHANITWAIGVSDTLNGRWSYHVYNLETHCWQVLDYMEEFRNGIMTDPEGDVTYLYDVPEAALAHLVTNYGMTTPTLIDTPTESLKLITRNYMRLIGMASFAVRPSDYILYRPKYDITTVNEIEECTPSIWWYSISIDNSPLMEIQPDARDYDNGYNPYLININKNEAFSLYQRTESESVQLPVELRQVELIPLFSYTGIWYDSYTDQVVTTWRRVGTNTYEHPITLEHLQLIINTDISLCDDNNPQFCFYYDQDAYLLELHCQATRIICMHPSANEFVSINMINSGVRKILNCKLCEAYQNDVLDQNDEYKCLVTCDTSYPKVSKITMGMTSSGVSLDLLKGTVGVTFTSSNIMVHNASKYEEIYAKMYLFERPTTISGNNVVFYEFSYDLWNSVT